MTRVPLTAKGKANNDNKCKNTPKEADRCSSGLNSESNATPSASNTTSVRAATHPMSRAASDLPQCGPSTSASSKPAQSTKGLIHTGHSSPSTISHNFVPLQTTRSNTAQDGVAQVGQRVPQTVSLQISQAQQFSRSLPGRLQFSSHFQPSSSVPGQTVLNIISSNLPQHQVVLPPSQSGVVLAAAAAAAPPGPGSGVSTAHPSVSVHTASLPSINLNSLINTQSRVPTSNQSVPSFLTLAPVAQSSQAMSNPQPSSLKPSSSRTQQSISQAVPQAVSGQAFPSRTAPMTILPPYSQAVSTTQSVNLQPSRTASTQSRPSQITLINVANNIAAVNSGRTWKFYQCTPVLTESSGAALKCVPEATTQIRMIDGKSSHPTSSNVYVPQAPRLHILPVSSQKEPDPPVSNMPPLTNPAAPNPGASTKPGQIECATQTVQIPSCEPPVKAPADSVCEGDVSVCSRDSPVVEGADLPTSTVPETDTKAKDIPAVRQAQDPHPITSVKDCPPNQSFLNRSESPLKSSPGSSSLKPWLVGLPSSFREILCSDEKSHAEDACSRSVEDISPSAKVINLTKCLTTFMAACNIESCDCRSLLKVTFSSVLLAERR